MRIECLISCVCGLLLLPAAEEWGLAEEAAPQATPAAQEPTPVPQKTGKNPFNPNSFIQEREFDPARAAAAAEIKEGKVTVDGVRYRVFRSEAGRILLPYVDSFTPDDLDKATCARGTDPSRNAALVRAEQPLGNRATAYADIIHRTIVARCVGESQPTGKVEVWDPKAEIGIRLKDEGKKGSPSLKIYNENLKPNVGVGAEF